MEKQLIILKENLIIISDDNIIIGDDVFDIETGNIFNYHQVETDIKNCRKIIAQKDKIKISDDVAQKIGWFDVNYHAKKYANIKDNVTIDEEERYYNPNCNIYDAYIEAFNKIETYKKELFTLEDVHNIIQWLNKNYSKVEDELALPFEESSFNTKSDTFPDTFFKDAYDNALNRAIEHVKKYKKYKIEYTIINNMFNINKLV